jgi:hypothetical protein
LALVSWFFFSLEIRMSTKPIPLTQTDKLEREFGRLLAAQKRQLKNEDIHPVGNALCGVPQPNTTESANSYTDPPVSPQIGQQFPASSEQIPASSARISDHEVPATGQQSGSEPAPVPSTVITVGASQEPDASASAADPLEELLSRALSKPRRGRPATFDEHNKGKLVALLSLGMSLRQAAAVLGVSHGTIHNTLKADPALAEEITSARFQAQLQPLACVIREARRSWKAATWLLKYLDAKIATHEETPDERRTRQQRESDEFFDHAAARHKKAMRS